jgi:hypothetical protein
MVRVSESRRRVSRRLESDQAAKSLLPRSVRLGCAAGDFRVWWTYAATAIMWRVAGTPARLDDARGDLVT